MATTKTDPWKVKKKIFIEPRVGKNQPDFVVSVNGKSFPIPRGVEWEVPLPIYEAAMDSLKHAAKANNAYYKIQQNLLSKAAQEEDNLK